MTKIFNWISVSFAFIGGGFSYLLGGWDALSKCLLIFIVIDYITGVISAAYTGKLSSAKGFKGIVKKAAILLTVCFASIMQGYLLIPVRDMVITFFVVNDALSILENLGQIIPLPAGLKKAVESLRGEEKNG